MENRKTESEYRRYVQQLTELCKGESEERLKEALKDRLAGGGPPLLRDEGDRLDVLILVYSGLRKQKNKKAMYRLRKSTVDLLMKSLRKYEYVHFTETSAALEQVDFLGHLVGWFEVKEEPGLSVELVDRLYGFMANRLKVPVDRLMNLDGMALETAVRAFDLWLAATSWNDAFKWPNHLQQLIRRLFKHNIKNLKIFTSSVEDTNIRLLFLSYWAVLRANPLWVGQHGLLMMTDYLDQGKASSNKIMKRWWGLCHELKILFLRKTVWREEFLNGIGRINNMRNESIYFDELSPIMKKSLEVIGIEDEAKEKLIFSYLPVEKRKARIVWSRISEIRAGNIEHFFKNYQKLDHLTGLSDEKTNRILLDYPFEGKGIFPDWEKQPLYWLLLGKTHFEVYNKEERLWESIDRAFQLAGEKKVDVSLQMLEIFTGKVVKRNLRERIEKRASSESNNNAEVLLRIAETCAEKRPRCL